MALIQDIRTQFPNYKAMANDDFNRPHDLWDRPMYQINPVFCAIKRKYGDKNKGRVTTRQQIIDLFSQGKYYDGYLCALVWGNIGTYQGGNKRFNAAFSTPEEEVKDKIKNIKLLLSANDIPGAFTSMCKGGNNYLPGLGVSFFTKILYFVGATTKYNIQPLIFDVTSLKILNRIYDDANSNRTARQSRGHYLFFCEKMNEMSNNSNLDLPTPGHLEAFLFNSGESLL